MPVIDLPTPEPENEPEPERRRWAIRGSLTLRILAVNILALSLVAVSIFYLDGFRTRLVEDRRAGEENDVRIVATVLAATSPEARPRILRALSEQSEDRIRAYDHAGNLLIDSWSMGPPTFKLVDPASEPLRKHIARWMDAGIDRLVQAAVPPPFVDRGRENGRSWPEVAAVMHGADVASRVRLAPDRTMMTSAAVAVGSDHGLYLLSIKNARDVTRLVRAERFRLGVILLFALTLSAALSYFLARTIVDPLRQLARAAVRVRLGRAREVKIPLLPARRDEIGLLARALGDMSQALRQRIDSIEAFAADVTHELKNPLASLSSAVESLARVEDPALKVQLLDIVGQDVRRLDRLITDIAEVSRLDAQLSRTRFEKTDLGAMIEQLLAARRIRDPDLATRIAFARPRRDTAVVFGDESRLARVFENLIDNALSFSPPGGVVRVGTTRVADDVIAWIEDDGPGIPSYARNVIFNRFHSERLANDEFGTHSGLGLAIAKTIVDGHNGMIEVAESDSGTGGARFVIRLPAA